MPKFGKKSLEVLSTCDKILREICLSAIQVYDFSVLEGHRNKERQGHLFNEGKTKVLYPNSKHNMTPSLAICIAPYPIDWSDYQRFHFLAGVMFGVAHTHGVYLRWGGDWNGNFIFSDQKWDDLLHFELIV